MFTPETPTLNAKSSENFRSPDQNWANFGGFRGLGVRVSKSWDFYPKQARLCVNPRRLNHFASKSVEGCDLQVGSGKKSESHRDFHRKDMSLLTQGLNYRSAYDHKNPTYQQLSCHQDQPQCFDAADWVTMTISDNQLQHSTTETLTHHSISDMFKVHLP